MLDLAELLAYVLVGSITGLGIAPLIRRWTERDGRRVPLLILWLATPLLVVFWLVSAAVAAADTDLALATAAIRHAIGQEVFVASLALGLWVRMRRNA